MYEIKEITSDEARKLVDSGGNCDVYEPLGLFYVIEKNEEGITIFVGIDNSDGHCWVEEFYSIGSCMAWLRGESDD